MMATLSTEELAVLREQMERLFRDYDRSCPLNLLRNLAKEQPGR